jgi:acetyl esterase/lipase
MTALQRLRALGALSKNMIRVALRRRRQGPLHPTWSLAHETVVDWIRNDMRAMASSGGLTSWRAWRERNTQASPMASRVRTTRERLGDVPVSWIVPRDGHDHRVVLYLHGGGYVFGSPRTHADLMNRVALAARARVVAPDYRLAPEHPFPAALDDVLAVWDALVASGVAPETIALAGDSAGGGLSMALALTLRDRGVRMPAALVLLSPWVDLAERRPSVHAHEVYDYLTADGLTFCAAAYAGDHDLREACISPVYANMKGLPPMLVQVGELETLLDDARLLAARAREDGVAVTLEELSGLVHVGHFMALVEPRARDAFVTLGAFVRGNTSR